MMQVNCLSPFLLTMLFMSLLRSSSLKGGARIVFVGSSSFYLACRRGGIQFDDLQSRHNFRTDKAYPHSKLALELVKTELTRRLAANNVSVTCNSVSPGSVLTSITRDLPWIVRTLHPVFLFPIEKTAQPGSWTSTYAACSTALNGKSGLYLEHCAPHRTCREAWDPTAALRMFQIAEDLTVVTASSVDLEATAPSGTTEKIRKKQQKQAGSL